MNVSDLLLFYRSEDVQSILSIRVIESIEYDMKELNEILSMVGKHTLSIKLVYSKYLTIYII